MHRHEGPPGLWHGGPVKPVRRICGRGVAEIEHGIRGLECGQTQPVYQVRGVLDVAAQVGGELQAEIESIGEKRVRATEGQLQLECAGGCEIDAVRGRIIPAKVFGIGFQGVGSGHQGR